MRITINFEKFDKGDFMVIPSILISSAKNVKIAFAWLKGGLVITLEKL